MTTTLNKTDRERQAAINAINKAFDQENKIERAKINGLECHVDWLTFIGSKVTQENIDRVFGLIGSKEEVVFLFDQPRALGKGCKSYENIALSVSGSLCLFTLDKEANLYDYVVYFSGKHLTGLRTNQVWKICNFFWQPSLNAKISRFDNAIDDHEKKLKISDCMDAIANKDYTGFKKAPFTNGNLCSDEEQNTLYLGSRESHRVVRVYDTKPKHGFDATRFETEYKREKAKSIYCQFLKCGREFLESATVDDPRSDDLFDLHLEEFLCMCAVDGIGFIDRSNVGSNGAIADCPNLPFWQSFLDRLKGAIRIRVPKRVRRLDKTIQWISRGVAKSLASLQVAMGRLRFSKWLISLIAEKSQHLTAMDYAMIFEYNPNADISGSNW